MNRRDFLGACAALPLIPAVTSAKTTLEIDRGIRRRFCPEWTSKYRLRVQPGQVGSLVVTVVEFQKKPSIVLFNNHFQSTQECWNPDFSPFQWKLVWELDPFGQWHPNISETGFEERNHLHHQMACLDAFLERNRQAMQLAVNAAQTPRLA
jgi:hypothetical protein